MKWTIRLTPATVAKLDALIASTTKDPIMQGTMKGRRPFNRTSMIALLIRNTRPVVVRSFAMSGE